MSFVAARFFNTYIAFSSSANVIMQAMLQDHVTAAANVIGSTCLKSELVAGYEPHSALPTALQTVLTELSPVKPPGLKDIRVLTTAVVRLALQLTSGLACILGTCMRSPEECLSCTMLCSMPWTE